MKNRPAANRTMLIIFALGLALCITLLLSGKRPLVWETKVNPGDHYVVADYGDLGVAESASLVCRYFTGRSVQTTVYWHSPNNLMGRDQCPFLMDERE